MALLFMDGFDVGDYNLKGWSPLVTGSAQTSSISSVAGRVGGQALQISVDASGAGSAEHKVTKTFPAVSQITVGVAVRLTAYTSNESFFISFLGDAGSTQHVTLATHPTTRVLRLLLGGPVGTQVATSTTTMALNTWYYFEIQTNINDSPNGNCVVRMNGSTTPLLSYTNSDTKNGGTATTIDGIRLGVYSGSNANFSTCQFDDLYALDNSGTSNTTFIGDVRVATLQPNAAGTDTQLTPTGSATNWQNVDETSYSTADYNGSATVGQRDTYALTDLPGTVTTVHALQSNIISAKSDATTANARIPIRTGGALYYGQTAALSTTYLTYSDVYNINPDTSVAWTPANVNGLEAGMEVA